MSNTTGPQMPAGWFRDPGGSDQLRWWDGTAWTSHLAPVPVPQPVAPAAPTVPVVATPTFTPTATHGAGQPSDPTERPYVPFQNSWNSNDYQATAGDFARPLQWNTGGVWFLATSLLWSSILAGVLVGGYVLLFGTNQFTSLASAPTTTTLLSLEFGTSAIFILLLVLAAIRDRARLKQLGYLKLTSPAWILLVPPLIYLIVRTIRVRQETGRGAAPLVFYCVTYVVVIGLSIVSAIGIPVFLASHGGLNTTATDTANASSLASGITTGMDKNGGSYSVSCTPFAEPKTTPIDVTCQAVDTGSQVSHTLQIEIDPGVNGGQPTVKLLSVTPPISQ